MLFSFCDITVICYDPECPDIAALTLSASHVMRLSGPERYFEFKMDTDYHIEFSVSDYPCSDRLGASGDPNFFGGIADIWATFHNFAPTSVHFHWEFHDACVPLVLVVHTTAAMGRASASGTDRICSEDAL
jgi:hypothetical protein